jgi:hypothetical protein
VYCQLTEPKFELQKHPHLFRLPSGAIISSSGSSSSSSRSSSNNIETHKSTLYTFLNVVAP